MNYCYIIQDENGNAWAATFEEEKAIDIINQIEKAKGKRDTYRPVPFYKMETTEINLIAGPIPKEYLPSSERTLMGEFKADAW